MLTCLRGFNNFENGGRYCLHSLLVDIIRFGPLHIVIKLTVFKIVSTRIVFLSPAGARSHSPPPLEGQHLVGTSIENLALIQFVTI